VVFVVRIYTLNKELDVQVTVHLDKFL